MNQQTDKKKKCLQRINEEDRRAEKQRPRQSRADQIKCL